jgi:hypothetical protein
MAFIAPAKFNNEIMLDKLQPLIPLPMSLKEIFLGKYLSIVILSFFYIVIVSVISKLISLFFFYGTLRLNLILIISSMLLFIILQIYFAINALLSLKYKNKYITIIFQFASFIIIILLIIFGIISGIILKNNEFFNLLNQNIISSNVSTNILSAIPDHIFWLILSGIGLISGIIIVILLSIMIYLLNNLNKEKII